MHEIARRSRGTPRIANRLLRRVRDFAEVDHDGRITEPIANDALNRMEVDTYGLDEMDRKFLLTIIEKFDGGPVRSRHNRGCTSRRKGFDRGDHRALSDADRFLNRTPRGRMATRLAYEHLGLSPVTGNTAPNLFE